MTLRSLMSVTERFTKDGVIKPPGSGIARLHIEAVVSRNAIAIVHPVVLSLISGSFFTKLLFFRQSVPTRSPLPLNDPDMTLNYKMHVPKFALYNMYHV